MILYDNADNIWYDHSHTHYINLFQAVEMRDSGVDASGGSSAVSINQTPH